MLQTSHARVALRRRLFAAVRAVAPSVALVGLLGSTAHAQTYYVDALNGSCNNTGAGTAAQPYCSITAAMTAHKGPGITIIVMPGIYREQVTVPASGAAGSPFVFQASGPGVVIEGSDDFANPAMWAASAGTSFLAASVTWTPTQVFVDGARLTVTTSAPGTMPANSFIWVSGQGLYVTLDGTNPGNHATLVTHRSHGFNLSTKAFVTIDGFEITHTNDRGVNMQTGCTDLVVSNNKISFTNSYGIQTVNGQRITIQGNTVSDINFHGIGLTAGASGCMVKDNEAFRCIYPPNRQANGIYLNGSTGNTICGNRLHDNQDTGLQFTGGANSNISFNNRSWANGDHGYDHLTSTGVVHVNDVAFGNVMDGFSFEGNSGGGQLHNSIAVDNGLTRNEFDLWVDSTSFVGFGSDNNLFWNSTTQSPIKIHKTTYATIGAYQALGQDAHSKQADPKFVNSAAADFHLLAGSPAIDAAMSSTANWPATDAAGAARVDDPATVNTGSGPVTYADMGVFEFVPPLVDHAPVVTAPGSVKGTTGQPVTFTVTAADPDGNPITSLTMVAPKLPAGSGATFTPNATNTGGTFSWPAPAVTGKWSLKFVATNALTGSATTNLTISAPRKHDGTGEEGAIGTPVVAMSQGSPNPSAGAVSFALDLPEASDVDLSVYDMQGRRVYQESQALPAGRSSLSWSGLNANRQRVGTGMYFVRAQVGEVVMVRRVVRF